MAGTAKRAKCLMKSGKRAKTSKPSKPPETEADIISRIRLRYLDEVNSETFIRSADTKDKLLQKLQYTLGTTKAVIRLHDAHDLQSVSSLFVDASMSLQRGLEIPSLFTSPKVRREIEQKCWGLNCEVNAYRAVLDEIRGPFLLMKLPAELRKSIIKFYLSSLPSQISRKQTYSTRKPFSAIGEVELPTPLFFANKMINAEISSMFLRQVRLRFKRLNVPVHIFEVNPFLKDNIERVVLDWYLYDGHLPNYCADLVKTLLCCSRLKSITLGISYFATQPAWSEALGIGNEFFKKYLYREKPTNSYFFLNGMKELLQLRGLEAVNINREVMRLGYHVPTLADQDIRKQELHDMERILRELLLQPREVEDDDAIKVVTRMATL